MTDAPPQALPLSLFTSSLEGSFLLAESNAVVALRIIECATAGPNVPGEVARMIAEKPPAFAAGMLAATYAAFGGQRPDQIAAAALRPLRYETSANARRLMARV